MVVTSARECGVCGLLFENCIVDASILRTGATAEGGPFGGCLFVVVPEVRD
jgi:hypothetical protein